MQPSRLWQNDDMEYVAKAYAIMHNMIMEYRDDVEVVGTRKICSLDPDAEVIPVHSGVLVPDDYEASDFIRERVDTIDDKSDHIRLQQALADAIWLRHGKDDEQVDEDE